MAWHMPGQWNPGVPQMTPDLGMGMGSYTAEQWAAVQQQNWQQWTQWQQQYSQWQSQYGEKYAEQIQSMQGMGVAPPLPPANTAPPPAPPPPEKPPPPPHENNQPLFGQVNPVPATGSETQKPQTGSSSNFSIPTGNSWQHGMETRSETSQQGVNTEALKKLAEEERLFDIQFEKWEEEIQKWKRENVNHPDRQAYNEYEQKFETCRAQLLERRQVMKQKRARLMGQAPIAARNNTTTTGNITTTVPPLLQNTNSNQNLHMQSQSHNNAPGHSSNQYQHQDNSQNNYKPQNKMLNQNFTNELPQNHQGPQYNNNMQSQAGFNRGNNQNVNLQDTYDSYQQQHTQSDNYSSLNIPQASNVTHTNFLPGLASAKGIPGLDLVPEDKAAPQKQQDVIDITDETPTAVQLPPDYTTISKGINNILGDEKIMNILSMVRDQGVPQTATNIQGSYVQKPPYNTNNDKYNAPTNNQWDRNQNASNQQYENVPSNVPLNRRASDYANKIQQENSQQYPAQKTIHNERDTNMTSEPYYDRNVQFSAQNMNLRGPPPMRFNMPPPRPLMQGVHGYQNDGGFAGGPQRGPSDVMRPMRPNAPPPRPLIQGMPGQDDDNTFSRGTHGNRPPLNNMVNPAMNKPPPLINKAPSSTPQPARKMWVEEPLFTPSIIVEYEHKPLRLKAREFIEPVHIFEYSHKSKDSDNNKKKDFEREADELFARKPRRIEGEDTFKDNRFGSRDYERRYPREEFRDNMRDARGPSREEFDERRRPDERGPPREEYYNRRRLDERGPPRVEYDDRRRPDERFDERRRDDRERYSRREDFSRDRERDREDLGSRDRQKDYRRDDFRNRSRSRDRDSRKRGRSKESTLSENSTHNTKKSKEPEKKPEAPKHVVMIDDLLEPPGREMRPEKIVIILRGPPGSGKSYLAKLIRDREAEHGGTARIMSIDDYFMQEGEVEEKDPVSGKIVKKPSLKYEYEAKSEETYMNSLKRAFKRSLTDGYFTFLIYDAVNDTLRSYADIWNFARQNGFQVYICTLELDSQTCFKRNIHGRTLGDVQVICTRFFPTPEHHIQLDATTLLQNAAITNVEMEDIDDEVIMEDAQEPEVESSFTSKWEKLDDLAQLARLDGTSKPLRASQPSMEDYLQLDDWKPTTAKPGKKSVRWADIEESREQEKMRAIGFVVGQTDWHRMTDPTMGSSALTQTKYIERVKRN